MTVLAVIVAGALFAFAMTASAYTHMGTLKMGSTGSQVMSLQQALNGAGYLVSTTGAGSPGMESTYFGAKTKAAVMALQSAKGLTVDGVVGPMTGAALSGSMSGGSYPAGCTSSSGYSTTTGLPCSGGSNLPAGCTSTAGYSPTTGAKCDGSGSAPSGPLTGGAGSVDSYNLVSGLGNEEVGEDEEDVQVAGLEIEVGEDSDLEFTAVRLVFNEGGVGTTSDFEDYADEVSIWLDGEEVGRVDANKFNDDNNWTATVSLDGAVARADDTVELVVAVSGISNLDSNDASDTWTVDFTQVRFMDADDAIISEDPTVGLTTFSFETFAAAVDTNFKITPGEDDDTVNDAHVIDIDATDETDNVDLLSFNVEIEGDSDVNLDALPVRVTVATQDNVDEMISGLSLWMDGTEVGTATMADCQEDADCASVGTMETFLFDDMDLDLNAGDDYEFLVKADIYGLTDTGDVTAGDTILAEVGEIQTDLASFKAEDESGEDLADGDINGGVAASASEVRDVGISVELVSATAVKTAGDASATQSDSGLFTITFDVTAFGADMYIDATAPDATGGSTESDLTIVPAAGPDGDLTCTITSPSGATQSTSFLVEEDETERFAITCDVRDGTVDLYDAFFSVALANLAYAIDDAQTVNIDYTFNLEDFKTPQIFLDDNGA